MKTRSIEGLIAFEDEEYVYTAECEQRGKDWYPDRITALDCANGALLDGVDYEALEAVAMQNAWLLDWCEDRGWEIEDSGGGCSALVKEKNDKVLQITKPDDPSAPQTLHEPVLLGIYDEDSSIVLDSSVFPGGISEIMSGPAKSMLL